MPGDEYSASVALHLDVILESFDATAQAAFLRDLTVSISRQIGVQVDVDRFEIVSITAASVVVDVRISAALERWKPDPPAIVEALLQDRENDPTRLRRLSSIDILDAVIPTTATLAPYTAAATGTAAKALEPTMTSEMTISLNGHASEFSYSVLSNVRAVLAEHAAVDAEDVVLSLVAATKSTVVLKVAISEPVGEFSAALPRLKAALATLDSISTFQLAASLSGHSHPQGFESCDGEPMSMMSATRLATYGLMLTLAVQPQPVLLCSLRATSAAAVLAAAGGSFSAPRDMPSALSMAWAVFQATRLDTRVGCASPTEKSIAGFWDGVGFIAIVAVVPFGLVMVAVAMGCAMKMWKPRLARLVLQWSCARMMLLLPGITDVVALPLLSLSVSDIYIHMCMRRVYESCVGPWLQTFIKACV